MSLRVILLALSLSIAIVIGALHFGSLQVGWYRYCFSYPAPPGERQLTREFYSPVAIPMRYISWVICKVKPPKLGESFGIGEYDCLQRYKRGYRPKGWNSDW